MNVVYKIGVILFLLCPYITLYGQEGKDTLTFRIVSYNVENLFDCRHDTLKNDYEFLPDAVRHWNYSKYRKKLDNIARVIIATGGWTPPALVALCEVENDSVMRDLTRYSALREADYRYVMTQSPDERGIDVALLYQRNLFKLLSYQSLPVDKPRKNSRPTRDILHVSGLLLNRDTLDVLVAHFPSRSGGARESEPYRLLAARKVKYAIDSLYTIRRHPQIVLLGDFNDYPENKSVKEVLEAVAPSTLQDSLRPQKLYHLLAEKAKTHKHFGSYKHQGEWGLLDHIIVSGTLLQEHSSLRTEEAKSDVFCLPFLLTRDKKYGGQQPFRTYYGMKYQGGYSDHLPVYAEFRLIY
ncbi:endonuclease [Bacteroides sp. KH569_7]|uniref:Endonuclease n=1 Tax=Bacteroides muris (ex Fokt et al. 2023) TaxID=2937417 RepID=A0A9X2NXH2_9BACE|nr:endonuclease/exonuclease/phosphatase family protein [Bacteroides muris (ex Fokt et al. 2023)]MCR6506906.1 endonuclease [Bacteroides muris (ex Fokt et al. 2023)]